MIQIKHSVLGLYKSKDIKNILTISLTSIIIFFFFLFLNL